MRGAKSIVSGGAINSPVLLLVSGIGPAAELKAHGIEVQHDLPGVGKNLQDHYQASFAFKTNATDTLNEAVMSRTKSAKLALEWLLQGSGQLAVGATEATMFCKSSARRSRCRICSTSASTSRRTA